jgi:hypothetical protein
MFETDEIYFINNSLNGPGGCIDLDIASIIGQVLAWDRHKNVTGLNWLMGIPTLPS